MKKVLCILMGFVALASFVSVLCCVGGIEQRAEGVNFSDCIFPLITFGISLAIANRLYEED